MNDSELVAAIRNLLGATAPTAPAASAPDWWNPTPADYAAFAREHGVPVEAISPWVQSPTGQIGGMAFPKLSPVTAREEIFKYAGFGYAPDGTQRVFTDAGFQPRRKLCDALKLTTTAAERDHVLTGAGAPGVELEAAQLSVMTGLVSLNPFVTPTMAGGPTVNDVIRQLVYVPVGSGGPGPSGRP